VADIYSGEGAPEVHESGAGAVVDEHAQAEAAKADQAKLLATAKERFALALEAESENRAEALLDDKFAAGEQWDDHVKRERQADGRPCLVVNRVNQSLQQITNDQRQNRPSIKVHPVDDQADVETAKAIQGIIRHIEYNSSADTAYDSAFDQAARGGWGYFRIVTDHRDARSFEQEIFIKRIRSRFEVAFDPASREPDGSDASFAFIEEIIPRSDYEALYPDSELASSSEWAALENQSGAWVSKAGARVVEYFYKDTREDTLLQLSNGETHLDSELDENARILLAHAGVSIVKSRKTRVPVVKWCKFNGAEILSQTDWPGKYIPIVPVYGAESVIDGKRILSGLVRNSKDPQRMYNYMVSAEAESIGLAPKAPFIGYAGQFEGREAEWELANRRNRAYLEVNPTSINGQIAPLPQRNVFEPAVQAITQARMMAADDVKAATGIYDASLGAKSNETSGIAIQRRNTQAQTANFHFVDNLTRSLRHAGRILVDLIPKVYDTTRAARIIGEDGEQKVVTVNAVPPADGSKPAEPLYALDSGTYDVTVDVGPSYASKRQEAAASMADLTRAYPQLMQVAGDLLIKNLDWPGASDLAERIKKTIPPNLLDDGKGQPQVPPQIQAQLQQQGAMIEHLSQELHNSAQVLEQKRMELESRERIEMEKLRVQLIIESEKLDAKHALESFNAELSQLEQRLKLVQMSAPVDGGGVPDAPPPQVPAEMPAGGPPAQGAPSQPENPTGGESPGQPLE
jgi:hypothetical protein